VGVLLLAGNLHFANVLQTDSLRSLGDDVRYVCIINNPLLGAFLQGDDQKLRPSDYQGTQRSVDADPRGGNCVKLAPTIKTSINQPVRS